MYISTISISLLQVMSLFHSPLSTLIKGTVVANEETFVEVMPIAWELLLESDQQLAAVAGVEIAV